MIDCYHLITEETSRDFENEVVKYLEEGWQLHGDPFFNSVHEVYCQAVVASEKEE